MFTQQSNKATLILLTAVLLAALALVASQRVTSAAPTAQTSSCTIPPSGPWPACATGGSTTNNNNSCVIPPSGPWPACARNGGATTGGSSGGGSGSGSCVIPASGPWPACAKGGNAAPTPASGALCPPSGGQGKWIPCGTNPVAPTPTPQGPAQPTLCPPPGGQGKWILCNVASGAPKVNSFWGTVTPVGDGTDSVELTWDTQGGAQVQIIVGVNFVWSDFRRDVEASGTTTVIYDSDYLTKGNIGVSVCDSRGSNCDQRLVPVTFSCEREYFFSTANYKPGACSADNYRTRQASYQQFEHGFAIWIDDWTVPYEGRGPAVLFFLDSGLSRRLDTWQAGEPVTDASLVPPAGKRQPTHGIGKAWRNDTFIKEALGWAVSAEIPYTAESVAANNAPIFGNSTTYLSLPNDNQIIEFSWGRRSNYGAGFTVQDL